MAFRIERQYLILLACMLFLGTGLPMAGQPAQQEAPIRLPEAARIVIDDPATKANDSPTTRPKPLDLPEVEDIKALMQLMEKAHRASSDRDPRVARKALEKVGEYARVGLHPRFHQGSEEYDRLALALYVANLDAVRAMEAEGADRRRLARALRGQGEACHQCHKKYRPDPDSPPKPAATP